MDTVRLLTFFGKQQDFQIWRTQFQAYAVLNKFKEALKDGGESDLPGNEADSIDESTNEDKKQNAAKRRNEIAIMANFSIAFTTEANMGMLYQGMASEWSSGLAHLAVEMLRKNTSHKILSAELI